MAYYNLKTFKEKVVDHLLEQGLVLNIYYKDLVSSEQF